MKTEHLDLGCQFDRIKKLSDSQLAEQLGQLAGRKYMLDADLLLYLSELDFRGLYREHAVSSLFEYCVTRLGFSEDVAYKRVGAARLLRQFPLVYELLSAGRIHLSALMLMRPHLTYDNHREWLLAATGKSKRQVELLVASRVSRPDVAASVRKIPEPKTKCIGVTQCPESQGIEARRTEEVPVAVSAAQTTSTTLATPPARATPAARVSPLSSSTYRITFTASECQKQKLDRARELTSHAVAPSDLPRLIERALDLLIEREERRRFAVGAKDKRSVTQPAITKQQLCQVSRPESQTVQDPGRVREVERSRYVPAAVRRAVWQRDGGCCTYTDAQGNRCNERHFLEIEHRNPFAKAGATSVDELRTSVSVAQHARSTQGLRT